jgi:hypothetical protein
MRILIVIIFFILNITYANNLDCKKYLLTYKKVCVLKNNYSKNFIITIMNFIFGKEIYEYKLFNSFYKVCGRKNFLENVYKEIDLEHNKYVLCIDKHNEIFLFKEIYLDKITEQPLPNRIFPYNYINTNANTNYLPIESLLCNPCIPKQKYKLHLNNTFFIRINKD